MLRNYERKIKKGRNADEEDFLLYLKIAEISGNSVLLSLMRIITPDVLSHPTKKSTSQAKRTKDILNEHREIVEQIVLQNAKGASRAMRKHLKGSVELF